VTCAGISFLALSAAVIIRTVERVVLAWSKEYTVLPKTGAEAYVVWDKEAKRGDGSWDLDRVERSARFRCPHCAGDILDAHKTWMNRNGIWKSNPEFSKRFCIAPTPEPLRLRS
jgi:phage terminase large subunit GpA-like protein